MSKAKLKKELLTMSHEQMMQIILEAYDARKETREYFEFFLDPDVDKASEDARQKIDKEFKYKRGSVKFSITKVRAIIKNFEGLGVGAAPTIELMVYFVKKLANYEWLYRISDSYYPVLRRFVIQTLKYANDNGELAAALKPLSRLADAERGVSYSIRSTLRDAMADFAEQL